MLHRGVIGALWLIVALIATTGDAGAFDEANILTSRASGGAFRFQASWASPAMTRPGSRAGNRSRR